MESKAIRVLLVDDDINLRTSLADILTAKGFEAVKAETGAEALTLAQQQTIDVAVIDLRLEDMPGLEVLRGIQQRSPDTECILLTGHATQATAIEAVNLGAYSYIQKPFDVDQLLVTLRHAAEKRAAGTALRESEQRYQTLAEVSPVGIFRTDTQGLTTYVNSRWCEISGMSAGKALGNGWLKAVHPDDRAKLSGDWQDDLEEQAVSRSEYRFLKPDGSVTWVYGQAVPEKDESGRIISYIGTITDITDRKQAEEAVGASENHYRGLFEDSPISLWEEDFSAVKQRLEQLRKRGVKDFRAYLKSHPQVVIECAASVKILDVNKATLNIYRAGSKAELLKNLPNVLRDESYEQFREELVLIAEGRTNFDWEGVNQTLHGERLDVSLNWSVAPGHEDDLSRVIISVVDITERKRTEAERLALLEIMQGMAAAQDLPELLELIRHSLARVIYAENFFVVFHNKSTGLFEEVFAVDKYDAPMPPSKLEQSITAYVFRSNEPVLLNQASFDELNARGELELVGTNSASWLGAPLKTPNEAIGVIAVQNYEDANCYSGRDREFLATVAVQVSLAIERKRADEKLRAAESRLRALVEQVPAIVYTESAEDHTLQYISPQIEILTEYPISRWLEKADFWSEITHPDDREWVEAEDERTNQSGDPYRVEYRLITRHGDTIWVRDEAVLVQDENGAPLFWQGIIHDITDRKRAEQELRHSEEKIQNIIEHSNSMFYAHTADHLLTYVSPQSRAILDCEPEEAKVRWQEFLSDHPANLLGSEVTQRAIETGQRQPPYELELITRTGRKIWVQVDESPVVQSGKTTAIVGSLTDITERKRAESELNRRVADLTAIYESAAATRKLSSPAELEQEIIHVLEQVLHYDYGAVLLIDEPTGRLIPLGVSIQGEQRELVESNKELFASSGLRLGFGITGSVAQTGQSVRLGDVRTDNRYFAMRKDIRSELCVPMRIGEKIIGVVNIETPKPDAYTEEDQRVLETVGAQLAAAIHNARLYEDVQRQLSERRQAEASLQASQERYRMLAENTTDTVWLMDMSLQITYMSPSVTKLRGYTLEELNSIPLDQHLTAESFNRIMQMYAELLTPENLTPTGPDLTRSIELEYYRKDRTTLWIDTTLTLIRDPDRNPIALLGSGRDVTARRQAEEVIQQRLKELELLHESGQTFSHLLEPKEIGRELIELLARKMDWHHVAIRLYQSETGTVDVLAVGHAGMDAEGIEKERQRLQEAAAGLGKGLSGWVIKHGKSIRSGNLAADKRYLATYTGICSGLYVPIQAGGRTIGSIAIESETSNAFSEQDERILVTLASQAAIAFENARLYQEALRTADRRATLQRASREITAAGLDLQAVYASIHRAAAELMSFDTFIISRYDREQKEVEFIYTFKDGEYYPTTRLPVGVGIAGHVIQKRVSLCIRDFRKEKQIKAAPFGKRGTRSILAVPMFAGAEITGVLSVQSYQPGRYDQEDQTLLEMLAAYASAAIENARLYEAEQKEHHLSEALRDALGAGASLSTTLDSDIIMDRLLDALERVIPFDGASILYIDKTDKHAYIGNIRGYKTYNDEVIGNLKRLRFDLQTTANLRWMHEYGQPLVIPDLQADPEWVKVEGMGHMRSWVGAPIRVNDEVIAFFSIEKQEENFYTNEHTVLLQAFTGQATLALQNAHLFDQTTRRADLLSTLNEVSRKLGHLLDLESIGEAIIPAIEDLLGWTRGSIWLVEADGGLHMLTHSTPGMRGKVRQEELQRLRSLITRPGEGLIGWVIQNEQAIRCGDVLQEPRYIVGSNNIRSELCVPLKAGGKTIGCLNFESKTTNAFSEEDEQVLSTLAGEIAGAFERARLFSQTGRRAEELGALAQVSSALRTATTRAEMLPILLNQITEILQIEEAALLSHDPSTLEQVVELACGKWAKAIGQRLLAGEGASGVVAQTGQPFFSASMMAEKLFGAGALVQEPEAIAGLPLTVQKQFLGSLWVGRRKGKDQTLPLPFTEEEISLLGSIADMTANAIHRATLHERTVRHSEQMVTVTEIGHQLSEILDLEQVYVRLISAIRELLPDTCALYISLYDERTRLITCVTAQVDGVPVEVKELLPMPFDPVGKGRQSHVLLTGEPILANNLSATLQKDLHTKPIGYHKQKPESALYVPMFSKGAPIGLIQVQSYTPNRFEQEDVNLLSLVANTAAVTIENARLFAETQKRLHYLSALHNIDAAISASVDLRVTLGIILENITRELNVDAAAMLLMNPHTMSLEYTASRGFRARIIEGMRIRLGEGLAGQAAVQRRLVSLAEFDQEGLDLFGDEGFTVQYAVPLIAKGQVHGVLQIFHRTRMEPDTDWIGFLNTLAGQAAIAMDNSRLFEDLQRSNLELTLAYDATIQGWSQALELRDKETQGHTMRVTELTIRLANEVGLADTEMVHLRRGVLLHDIGKMGVPDTILLKPGPLTAEEWEIMRQHPVYAFEMLSSITYLHQALDVPYCHHEKWDGSGYPRGLKGEQIPLSARLFAVVDVYDAVTSDRPYRTAWGREQALDHIREQSGKHFDPQVVEAFFKLKM